AKVLILAAILQVGCINLAKADILSQMMGKSIVFMYTTSFGKVKFKTKGIVYFSTNGDIFYFYGSKEGIKISRKNRKGRIEDTHLVLTASARSVYLTIKSSGSFSKSTKRISSSGKSCKFSLDES